MLPLLSLQNFLFEQKPSRIELIKYEPTPSLLNFKVFVYRNHSFELIANTIKPYLDYAKISIDFIYSDYDDSLSFLGVAPDSDALILWLDLSRYNPKDLEYFINERILYLQKSYQKPILFAPILGKNLSITAPNTFIVDFSNIKKEFGDKFTDTRMEQFTGTQLSNNACLKISSLLGLNYLPAILQPALKAIVVDLDNTLYQGILGEDGVSGLLVTESHKKIQEKLITLVNNGLFLCISSKNEYIDVINLLKTHPDFKLKESNFTIIKASWQQKAKSIQEIADFLNISTDSILFIDDNIGEIIDVINNYPSTHYILANARDPSITLSVLDNYPRLLKLNHTNEDGLRKDDIIANQKRKEILSMPIASHNKFLSSLKMQLKIICNDKVGIDRIAELANKTNQFIFTYQRYTSSQINTMMNSANNVVVSIHLKDSLSDSGMVGALMLRREKIDEAVLEELFISCRALGRNIDSIIILKAIEHGLKYLSCSKLKVLFQKGNRNTPAEIFFNQYLCQYKENSTFIPFPNSDIISIIYT